MYRYTESDEPTFPPAYPNGRRLSTQHQSQPWQNNYVQPNLGLSSSTPTNFHGMGPYKYGQYPENGGNFSGTAGWMPSNATFLTQPPSALYCNNTASAQFLSPVSAGVRQPNPGFTYLTPYNSQPSPDPFRDIYDPAAGFGSPEPSYIPSPVDDAVYSERGVSMAPTYSRESTAGYCQDQSVPPNLPPVIPAQDYMLPASASQGNIAVDRDTMSALLDPLASPWNPTAYSTIFGPFETSPRLEGAHRHSLSPSPANALSPPVVYAPFGTPSPAPEHTTTGNDVAAGTPRHPTSPGTCFAPTDERYKVLIHSDLPPWTEGKEFQPASDQALRNWPEILPRLRAAFSGNDNRPQFEMKCFRGTDTLCISVKDIFQANIPLLMSKAAEYKIQILLRKRGAKGPSRPSNRQHAQVAQDASSPPPHLRQSPGPQTLASNDPTVPPRHETPEQDPDLATFRPQSTTFSASGSPMTRTMREQRSKQPIDTNRTPAASAVRHRYGRGRGPTGLISENASGAPLGTICPKNHPIHSARLNTGNISTVMDEAETANYKPLDGERDSSDRASKSTETTSGTSAGVCRNVAKENGLNASWHFSTGARALGDDSRGFSFPGAGNTRGEKQRQKEGGARLVAGGHGKHRHFVDSNLNAQSKEIAPASTVHPRAQKLTASRPLEFIEDQPTMGGHVGQNVDRADIFQEEEASYRAVSNKRPSNRTHSKKHKKGNSDSIVRSGTESSQSSFGENTEGNSGARGQGVHFRARSSSAPPLPALPATDEVDLR